MGDIRAVEGSLGTRPIRVAGRAGREVLYRDLRVRVLDGVDAGREAILAGPSLLVGTGEGCDLRLTDPTVSARHVAFTTARDGVLLEDVGSTNGVEIRGLRVKSSLVEPGAAIRIGDTTLAVEAPPGKLVALTGDDDTFHGMVGGSAPMREVYAMIGQLAHTDLPVLIRGETGTGKELVARALHEAGRRREAPLLVMDCGAVVPDLLRSELFGHERGSFTGATDARAGILEQARGGTVFFDEMGELPLALQPNLLRALELREVRRVGAARAVTVDFRIVAATNRDLERECREGRFREDLWYRLACVTIHLPPLRERPEDLPRLAQHFLEAYAQRNGSAPVTVTRGALERLAAHDWPGNLRELRNVLESASALTRADRIDVALVERLLAKPRGPTAPRAPVAAPAAPAAPASLPDQVQRFERDAILAALVASGWNKKRTAQKLGISLSTLFEKIRRFHIADEEPK